MDNFLTSEARKELLFEHKHEKDKHFADRLKTILHLDAGWSYEEIAEALLLDDSTIRRYEKNYLKGGIECLLTDDYKGGFGFLSSQQEELLSNHLQNHIYLSCKEVLHYIYKEFGIKYSVGGTLHLLKRLGFVYKKPKSRPGKADRELQERFLEEYRALLKTKDKKDPIYFVDGTHPHHNSVASYGWILKGVEKELATNTGRKRININGALDTQSMDLEIRIDESINAESTINLFKALENKNPKSKKIYVIADNARYYRSKKVAEFLQTSKVEILFLPPYSPNLNLIERFWKFFKKKILYNKYYDTYDKFYNTTLDFFKRIDEYQSELQTLLTNNFQIVK